MKKQATTTTTATANANAKSKSNYKENVISLNRKFKTELRQPKKVLKYLVVFYWSVINDSASAPEEKTAAQYMLKLCKEVQKDNNKFLKFCKEVRQNDNGQTTAFYSQQWINKNRDYII